MKRITYLLGASLLLMTTSCSSIGDLFKVKVDTQFDVNIPIIADSQPMKSASSYPFSGKKTFNPMTGEELKNHINKIWSMDLTDIQARVQKISEDFTILDATMTVSGQDSNGKDLFVTWPFTNFSITEGLVLTLSNAATQFFTLSSILTGLSEVTVIFSGNVDKPGVSFELFTQMFAKATVGL